MAMELIVGKAGTPHIDGNDIGTINQAYRGKGSYVLEWGDEFAAKLTGSNSVQIGTGCASMEGRDLIISAPETVTITSGSQGMKRNDLICVHYHRDSNTGVESTNLVVLKGTATSSNPADPSVPSGTIMSGSIDAYWKLYRVPLDGLTMGAPVQLFTKLPSIKTMGDSITQTEWKIPYSNSKLTLIKRGRTVIVNDAISLSSNITSMTNSAVLERLPDGYVPAHAAVMSFVGNNGQSFILTADKDNSVKITTSTGAAPGYFFYVHGAWIA